MLRDIYPLLVLGGIIGVFSIIFIVAYATMKNKKEAFGFERNMKDSEIIIRLLRYSKPYLPQFIIVGLIMLLSIAYNIISPIIMGDIVGMIEVEGGIDMRVLFGRIAIYASILIVSLVATYLQSIILQKIGQRILSSLREDVFTHI